MSQTFFVVTINGEFYETTSAISDEYFRDVFEYEIENGEGFDYCDVIAIEATKYDIGDGESHTDDFFTEEEIKEMWETGDFEREVEMRGYDIDLLEESSEGMFYVADLD